MKVYIVSSAMPIRGGVGSFTEAISHKLSSMGHESKVINVIGEQQGGGFTYFNKLFASIAAWLLNLNIVFLLSFIAARWVLKFRMLRDYKKGTECVVHAQDINAYNSLYRFCSRNKISLFLSIHGHLYDSGTATRKIGKDSWLSRYLLRQEIKAYRTAPFIITVSDHSFGVVTKYTDAEKVCIMRNFVDTDVFSAVSEEPRHKLRADSGYCPDDFVLIYTGRLIESKGIRYILEGVKSLTGEMPVKLILAGAGPLMKETQEYISSTGMKGEVVLTGEITKEEVLRLYRLADAFIIASVAEEGNIEGTPMSLLEAMACKLPVISTATGGIGGVVRHRDNAWVIKEKSAGDISEAVRELYTDRDLRGRLVNKALQDIEEKFSIGCFAQKIIGIYSTKGIKSVKTVLLTNGQLRKTLSAVRSLGAYGVQTVVSEETRCNPAGFSRYCRNNLAYPNPRSNPDGFYRWLTDTIVRYGCDIMYPMDDDTLEVVMAHKSELEKLCTLPLPSLESYSIVSDKGLCVQWVEKAGVECPKTYYPHTAGDVEKLAGEIEYPCVIKPRKSSGSRGIRVVRNAEQLLLLYKEVSASFPKPIIQEYIRQGDRYDVCLLYDKQSRLKASFVQKEIRHFPVHMGPSTVQEGTAFPGLLDRALKVMEGLPWYGVIEFEFMIDPQSGEPKFMEINPRFWNSLHMSVLSGVDFSTLLYRVSQGEEFEGVFKYKEGIRCRWLLPGDILHWLSNKERNAMEPSFFSGAKKNVYDDILSWDDPLPVLGFVMACLRYVLDIKKWKFLLSR